MRVLIRISTDYFVFFPLNEWWCMIVSTAAFVKCPHKIIYTFTEIKFIVI